MDIQVRCDDTLGLITTHLIGTAISTDIKVVHNIYTTVIDNIFAIAQRITLREELAANKKVTTRPQIADPRIDKIKGIVGEGGSSREVTVIKSSELFVTRGD